MGPLHKMAVECCEMRKELKEIAEDILDEIIEDIEYCAVITGHRPLRDCGGSCEYRNICRKIFAKWEEEKETN